MPDSQIKWKTCISCGRRFLSVGKQEAGYPKGKPNCPECQAKQSRKLIQDITERWLSGKGWTVHRH